MSELERHLGKGQEIEIDGEVYVLKPLTLDNMADFFKLAKAFVGKEGKQITGMDFISNLSDESLGAMKRLIYATLKRSCPGKSEDWVNEKGMEYNTILLSKILEMSSATTNDQLRKQQLLDKIAKKDG